MFKELTLLKIIKFGIFASLFTPLIVTENTIYPLIFGRTLLMQALVEASFGFWLALIYLYPKYRPTLSPIFSAVLIYFGLVVISSIFGVDFLRSFWGNEERMSGIFTQAHFLVLFVMATTVLRGWDNWRKVLLTSISASILMCAVALLHRYGFITIANAPSFDRIGGTIGNPIFFAAYLLFNIFFTLIIFVKSTDRFVRYFALSAGIFIFLTFLSANSRGVIVGLVIGLIAMALGYAIVSNNKKIRIASVAAIILVFLSIFVIWLNINSRWVSLIPGINRFATDRETIGTRFIAWESAIEAWKEYPILGWGEENFIIAFNKFYSPKLLTYSVAETWFDRAHNIILDRLVMNGTLGCLAYLGILAVAIFMLYKKYKNNKIDKHLFIILAGLLVAYFIQNFFTFDDPATLLLFFLVLAFINSSQTNENYKEKYVFRKSSLVYLCLFFPVFAIIFNFQLYKASAKSVGASSAGNESARLRVDKMNIALQEWTPYKESLEDDMVQGIVDDFNNDLLLDKDKMYCFLEAEKVGLRNVARHPNNARYFYILGRLYTEMARNGAPQYFEKSEEALLRAKELSPQRQQIFYGLGRLYLYANQYDKAVEIDREMVALEPAVAEPHWLLGIALLVAGKEEGYDEIIKAKELNYGPKNSADLVLFFNAFKRAGKYDMILDLYEDYVIIEDVSPIKLTANFCAEVAAIYAQKGEKEKAKEAARRAVAIDPILAKEAEIFIRLLDKK